MPQRHCVVCTNPILGKRPGAIYCSPECKKAEQNEIRSERAKVKCRLCGRRHYKPKAPKPCADAAQMEIDEMSWVD